MSIQFKTDDVVKLMLQFMKENGLNKSLKCLQEESQVSLNLIESPDQFSENIREGRWDKVLDEIQKLKLPSIKLLELYEVVVCELLELGESVAAQFVVKSAVRPSGLFEEFRERSLRLDYLSKKTPIDIRELYQDKHTKEKRRALLASSLLKEVVTAPSSRLLYLLGEALKHQQQQGQITNGIKLDLFTGLVPLTEDTEDLPTNKVEKVVQFGEQSRIICAEFNKNGLHLALGSLDGLIEIWDSILMRQKTELAYQKDNQFMFHEEAVHALAFSDDSEILASGDKIGEIKIWKVQSGKCLKKILGTGSESISQIKFGIDPSHLIVGYNKNIIKIFGLKSSAVLMEFRGSKDGSVNELLNLSTEELLSAGSDGLIHIWNSQTGEQKVQITLPRTENQSSNDVEIFSAFETRSKKELFVVERSSRLAFLSRESMEIVKSFINDRNEDFLAGSISPQKKLIYGITSKGYLYCFRETDGKIQAFFEVTKDEVLGIKHHPTCNIQVAFTSSGDCLFLKAA